MSGTEGKSGVDPSTDPLSIGLSWMANGYGVALATVVETWGSAPRPAGSVLVIRDDGQFEGSVSGGCVEGAVIAAARDVIDSGKPQLLEFGVSNAEAWEVGLSCGGRIRIYVEPACKVKPLLERVMADRAARRAVVLVTDIERGAHWLVYPESGETRGCELVHPDAIIESARTAARLDRSGMVDCAGTDLFMTVFNPVLRIMVVGAVHIAQSLALMARLAGYDVIIIDPRTAFANNERFPDVMLETDWPDEALAATTPDARTAMVTLTHDPKIDDVALGVVLATNAFYIGCLGSRKTHAARLARLSAAGHDGDALARIRGPVGLDIGARSPAEIAIAIMAEITATLRGRKTP